MSRDTEQAGGDVWASVWSDSSKPTGYWEKMPDITEFFWEGVRLQIGPMENRVRCDRQGTGLIYEYLAGREWVQVCSIPVNAARVILAAGTQEAPQEQVGSGAPSLSQSTTLPTPTETVIDDEQEREEEE